MESIFLWLDLLKMDVWWLQFKEVWTSTQIDLHVYICISKLIKPCLSDIIPLIFKIVDIHKSISSL